MQKELKKLSEWATVTILAQGDVFTLAKASIFRMKGPGKMTAFCPTNPTGDPAFRAEDWAEVTGEGMARRSHLDPQDINRGQEIAAGRALKALARKIQGNGRSVVRHRFMG